ncbi:MAG: hypothetical protein H6557_34380 [Lewinellaceae bacterium]|nr:hypothetical protein [Lewinellaceae bacterium]
MKPNKERVYAKRPAVTENQSFIQASGEGGFFPAQAKPAPFFGKSAGNSKPHFFSANALQPKVEAGQQNKLPGSQPQIQMRPGKCEVPKLNSGQFAKAIGKLVLNEQLTDTEASGLLSEYGAHGVSRCTRGKLIHKLKANATPAPKPVVQAPPQVPASSPATAPPAPTSQGSPQTPASSPATAPPAPTSQGPVAPTTTAGTPAPMALPDKNAAIDQKIQTTLEKFLDQFSNIPVEVKWVEVTDRYCIQRSETVFVHPPYFIARKGTNRMKNAEKSRSSASGEMKKLLKEAQRPESKGGMGLRKAFIAKGSPEDIQAVLQRALNQNLVPAGKGRTRPDSQDMQAWLAKYGIGVDCSGFVTQAINLMMQEVVQGPLEKGQQLDVVDIYSGNLKGGGTRFEKVKTPKDLRPGDTMHLNRPGDEIDHIRIIISVKTTPEGYIEFTTGESTSGGPRGATWRYEKADTFRKNPIKTLKSDGTWGGVKSRDSNITYGRYKKLESK